MDFKSRTEVVMVTATAGRIHFAMGTALHTKKGEH